MVHSPSAPKSLSVGVYDELGGGSVAPGVVTLGVLEGAEELEEEEAARGFFFFFFTVPPPPLPPPPVPDDDDDDRLALLVLFLFLV